ncbi:hypothetical protein N7463_010820 [Penicillium fimorum]|uniref:Protein kinase domain-containing protein n=1 Tax=Penicillium fimorum TaxID=1882269 RepID=A0A9W9XKM3_9EURO|nr:hypothetical protein N7463_010820 [Penicillium fimorum]
MATLDNPQLEILETNEAFEDTNGSFGFVDTMLKARYYSSIIVNPADLTSIVQIPPSAYGPLYARELTRAPDPLPKDTHVNSGALMKSQARSMQKTTKDYRGVLAGAEGGIRHLHSMGWIHNDINHSNIMFDGAKLVIVDFGSCQPIGESVEGYGGIF